MPTLKPEVIDLVASRFKVLAEPARLTLLQQLRLGEQTVTQLVAATGMGQTNVSRHLTMLLGNGFVVRRKEGAYAYYGLANKHVTRLCDIMCTQLESEIEDLRRVVR